ncbi:MAG TPA: histidine kinase [Nocardioides sp.]|nr:histidine kinase [Nocardioides sp.]
MRQPTATFAPLASAGALVTGAVVVAALATPSQFDRMRVGCGEDLCTDSLERPSDALLSQLDSIGMTAGGWAASVLVLQWLLLIGYCLLCLLVLRRRPSFLAAVTAVGLIEVALGPFADALGDGPAWRAVLVVLAILNQAALVLILALFPDGHGHPGRSRAWIPPAIAVASVGGVMEALGRNAPGWAVAAQTLVLLGLVVAQVHRWFRRSDEVARQQATWVLVGMVLLAVLVLGSIPADAAGQLPRLQAGFVVLEYLAFAAIGLGFVFAILRYRLYDAGLTLWRTFAYSLGLVAVLLGYFLLVALAGMSTARSSASVVGIAALAAAVLAGGWAAGRLRERLRRRLYGEGGGVAAALATSMTMEGGRLAEAIARALAVPYVAVHAADGSVASSHGRLPSSGTVRQTVLDPQGDALGELVLGPAYGDSLDRRDRRALAEVLPFVVMVLRAQRENEALRQARSAAAESREDERRRLRRELHDGVGPLLATQLVTLDTIRVARDRGVSEAHLHDALEEQTRSAIEEIRSITRQLRPPALDAGGLEQAIRAEAARVTGLQVECRLSFPADRPLPAAVEVNVLRLVQEALTNVVRHARASRATLVVTAADGWLDLEVTDDGVGRGDAESGVGTSSMYERVEELNGVLAITAGPDGRGTQVRGRIPW